MLSILKYIWNKNHGLNKLKYLIIGFVFQVFKRSTNSIVSKTIFNGKKLFLYPDCNVSTMYTYTNIPDKEELIFLRNIVDKGGSSEFVFLDIGSNIGSYSVSMMDICDSIVAFEPHPYTSTRCKMNFLLNNKDETDVKQIALSNEIGKIYFSDYGGSSTTNHIVNDRVGIEVGVTTLDSFIEDNNYQKDKKYIIKVDVEGFEQHVFEGGKNFLTNYQIEAIVFECFSENGVFNVLRSYGFKNIGQLSKNNYFAKKN